MQRDIGGYLEFERFSGRPFHHGAIALDSGRSCLLYLIELRKIARIWVPEWMCSAIFEACAAKEVLVSLYQVDEGLQPILDFDIGDDEYLYLVDYYGRLTVKSFERALERSKGRLIVDAAQSFFRRPWAGADTLYTCRKFFGVADGGYLYTKDGASLERKLPSSFSYAAMGHILGRFEMGANTCFSLSTQHEVAFDRIKEPQSMSPLTENLMRAFDYDANAEQRTKNYEHLGAVLDPINGLPAIYVDAPYMYPFACGNAPEIRAALIAEHVYVPTLWPNVVQHAKKGSRAWRLANNIIPLPVDQRYGAEEMDYITNVILNLQSK